MHMQIETITHKFHTIGINADVKLVELIDHPTGSEALTVKTDEPNNGQVYFKHFQPSNFELDGLCKLVNGPCCITDKYSYSVW